MKKIINISNTYSQNEIINSFKSDETVGYYLHTDSKLINAEFLQETNIPKTNMPIPVSNYNNSNNDHNNNSNKTFINKIINTFF